MRLLSAAVIAIALSIVACGGDDAVNTTETPTATATVSLTLAPTISPTQTASTPSPTAIATQKPLPTLAPTNSTARLIYTTGPFSYEGMAGPLWISNIAGSRTQALTPAGISVNFAGMTGDPLSGTGSIYYVTGVQDTATIYRITFPAGTPEHVLDFTPMDARFATAALSPDGSQIAYTDRYGLQLLDLQTYGVLQLAAGNPDPNCDARSCLVFSRPVWSPDGSRIAVHESFYEGGQIVVVDPSLPGAGPTKAGGSSGGNWSPDSSAICSWGGYDAPTGLYVSTAPDFATQNYLAEFNSPPPTGPFFGVYGCDWLDDHTVVVAIRNYSSPTLDQSYVELVDTMDGPVTKLTDDTPGAQCCDRLFADPNEGLVLGQYSLQTADPNVSTPSQPEAIDLATRQAYSTLEAGDWIIAVVTP